MHTPVVDLLAASSGETQDIANAAYAAFVAAGGLTASVFARSRARRDEEELEKYRKMAMEALARQTREPEDLKGRLKRLEARQESQFWRWVSRVSAVAGVGGVLWGGDQALQAILKAIGAG